MDFLVGGDALESGFQELGINQFMMVLSLRKSVIFAVRKSEWPEWPLYPKKLAGEYR